MTWSRSSIREDVPDARGGHSLDRRGLLEASPIYARPPWACRFAPRQASVAALASTAERFYVSRLGGSYHGASPGRGVTPSAVRGPLDDFARWMIEERGSPLRPAPLPVARLVEHGSNPDAVPIRRP